MSMALYTPRGLKIRLPIDYAFALIARLHPEASAFQVLKLAEGIESITAAATFLTGIILFIFGIDPIWIGAAVFFAGAATGLMKVSGKFIPGIIVLGTAYSYISGFGILLIAITALGWYLSGWQGVAAFFAGKLLAGIVNEFLETLVITNKPNRPANDPLTVSEMNFLNAYKIHARRQGKTQDTNVSDTELEPENWEAAFVELSKQWPEVVRRISNN